MTNATDQAVRFIEQIRFEDVPSEAVRIARRCVLDGLGLFVAGYAEDSFRVRVEEAKFGACAEDLLDEARQAKVIEAAWQTETLPRAAELARLIQLDELRGARP